MKKLIETVTGSYASSARVVDDTLILSLPNALSPVVWRMELGHVKASALEVKEKDGGVFALTLKTPKEEVHEIAPFATRAAAVKALIAASRALEQSGRARPAVANDAGGAAAEPAAVKAMPARSGGGLSRLGAGIVALALLGGMIFLFMNMAPKNASFPGMDTMASFGGNPATATGVPVSADDFLRQR